MVVQQLFCCFRNQQPNCAAFTGIGASVFSFAFLIWGLADLGFKERGVKAIYIIAFILIILSMIGLIILLIILKLRSSITNKNLNNIGRIICLAILIMCGIAFIFIVISFIDLIITYSKLRSDIKKGKFKSNKIPDKLKDAWDKAFDDATGNYDYYDEDWYLKVLNDELKIVDHEWAAIFVPSLFTLICLPLMALAANFLYKVFLERINTPTSVKITQNTIPTQPNIPQPGIFPNNNAPVPPTGNNVAYLVTVNQSELDLNK